MRRILQAGLLLASLLVLPAEPHSYAIAAPPRSTADPAINNLADKIAMFLNNARAKHVVVLDLRGPQGESHPAGKWLADQLSLALQSDAAGLEVIARSEIRDEQAEEQSMVDRVTPGKKDIETWRSSGADALISGTHAKQSQRLSITLNIRLLAPIQLHTPSIRGVVPISEEITSLSPEPMPFFKGDVFLAGLAGVTTPTCIYCPQPSYTPEARRAKYQGTVVLEVVVTQEGKVGKAIVISSPGYGLERNSLNTIKDWKLKPAEDVDGKPVATKVKVETTFHLY